MQWEEIITNAQEAGRSALTEAEAKQLLGYFGVPVVEEKVAGSDAEAADIAERMGFPVVVKGLGAKLTHKTERGLVRLGLGGRQQVLEAAKAIAAEAGADLEGYLVQPMLAGRREFVAGLIRDPQFGPTVMFGIGGIFTEAFKDVTFRIAPVSEAEAARMLDELKASTLLGSFRGEEPVDRTALIRALTGLSRLGMECPAVAEVDVNPLLADAQGRVAAVDALVILGDGDAAGKRGGDAPEEERDLSFLNRMFFPKSVAVTGVPREMPPGWPGLFGCMQAFGYPGRLYPINPKADEINGVKAYPSLSALPEKVDLVLISVPAPFVPANLRECIATGHRDIHIFTAGFKETGEEEGIKLQDEIEQIAVEGGLNVIGPNCMGLYVPKSRITTWTSAEDRVGPVAFVSQSGGHAQDLTHYANQFNIGFSKVISFGNALTLDSTDFLTYLRSDADTEIICMYLEGVKDGQKLARLVTEINRTKPILIMKGGTTDSGALAVASHTGSLSGGMHIWDAFFRQTGAVKCRSLRDMTDALLCFLHLDPPRGRRVGIMGAGGGIGVSAADTCSNAGLKVPVLAAATREALREFIPAAGNSSRNPVDAGLAFFEFKLLGKALEIVSSDPQVDVIIISVPLDWFFNIGQGEHVVKLADYIVASAKAHTNGKPFVVNRRRFRTDPGIDEAEAKFERILIDGGIPVYDGLTRAAGALSKLAGYHEFLRRHADAP